MCDGEGNDHCPWWITVCSVFSSPPWSQKSDSVYFQTSGFVPLCIYIIRSHIGSTQMKSIGNHSDLSIHTLLDNLSIKVMWVGCGWVWWCGQLLFSLLSCGSSRLILILCLFASAFVFSKVLLFLCRSTYHSEIIGVIQNGVKGILWGEKHFMAISFTHRKLIKTNNISYHKMKMPQ